MVRPGRGSGGRGACGACGVVVVVVEVEVKYGNHTQGVDRVSGCSVWGGSSI